MGICGCKTTDSISPQVISFAQTQAVDKLMLSNFSVCKELLKMLDGVAYTQNQAIDLAKALVEGVIDLEKPQAAEETQAVLQLFSQEHIELIRKDKLFYYEMVHKLNQKTKATQSGKSRIYHTIANIKKENLVSEKWVNEFQIDCIANNDYKELSKAELEQVVKYETIGDHIKLMGEKLSFKFQSIKDQSQKISKLLSECIVKNIGSLEQLKYDLNDEQVLKMAAISRQACNHYDNGVFILLVYFVQSCRKLENDKKSAIEIEKRLNEAIEKISKQYPPGEGLSQERIELINTLKQLEDPHKYQKVNFSHETIKLQPENKQAQVEEIITKYSIVAEKSKQLFEELIRATCLQRCISFKIGLKYYPKNPNKKALTRIKQKMFFKKNEKGEKNLVGSLKEILERQQINYKTSIDQILQNTENIKFEISDMVRGKCVFLQVSDIIETVNSIKALAAKDSRFGLTEIECRFTNPVPISDVTLKILINNEIVAELQLTIQTNAAAYNFAHKIYELQRTKVFSKLKITHNYFEESNDDFKQLTLKALSLSTNQSPFIPKDIISIKQFFNLQSFTIKSFQQILSEALHEKNPLMPRLLITVDPLLQDLMNCIFSISTGKWNQQLGHLIDNALKNDVISPKLKSVLLSYFFETFQLPKQAQYMQQLGLSQQQIKSKIFMEEYIKWKFYISNIYKYSSQNHRLFHRSQQLKCVSFAQRYDIQPILLQQSQFVKNLVIEQHCFQNIEKLSELFNIYFISRTQFGQSFFSNFSFYYNWINKQLQITKDIDSDQLRSKMSILKAQYLLQENNPKQAKNILEMAIQFFKRRQEHGKVIECDILLTECFVKVSNLPLQDLIQYHEQKIVKKAQALGLQLKGELYADAMWRISEYLWSKTKQDEKKLLLQTLITIAIQQMSRSKGKQLISAMHKIWKQFQLWGVNQPEIKQNSKIQNIKIKIGRSQSLKHLTRVKWMNLTHLDLMHNMAGPAVCEYLIESKWKKLRQLYLSTNSVQAKGCEYLAKADWPNLTKLSLFKNEIKDQGCLHLSNSNWKNLQYLYLNTNHIGSAGIEHLVRAEWKNLIELDLSGNPISEAGCEHLSKSNWKNLRKLYLQQSCIGHQACQHLSKADWKNLVILNLSHNPIKCMGCEHLSKANWKNLTQLYLNYSSIGDAGCQHLTNADWKHLTKIQIFNNQIGQTGSEYLSKSNREQLTQLSLTNDYNSAGCEYLWRNLTQLILGSNEIGDGGCEHLSKSAWKNIYKLDLYGNKIGDEGCKHLSKSQWKNFTFLNLSANQITSIGCEYLSIAQWKNFTYLNLGNNLIGNDGCKHLCRANWPKLETLSLQNSKISAEGCQYLSKSNWKHLSALELSYNEIEDTGCEHLSKLDWQYLRKIDLKRNKIGDIGCFHLSKTNWFNLRRASLNDNQIKDEGGMHLSKAKWIKLRQILIMDNKIIDKKAVKQSFNQMLTDVMI